MVGPAAVDGVQIQCWGAAVDKLVHRHVLTQRYRGGVHRQVVVDELPQVGETGRDGISTVRLVILPAALTWLVSASPRRGKGATMDALVGAAAQTAERNEQAHTALVADLRERLRAAPVGGPARAPPRRVPRGHKVAPR